MGRSSIVLDLVRAKTEQSVFDFFLSNIYFPRFKINMNQQIAVSGMNAAISEATKLGVKMNIAIVDAGGNLVMFNRMDGAWLGSIDIAMKKAKRSVFFNMPCSELGKLSQPGQPLFGIEHSNQGLITFPGGMPIHDANDVTIGGIGVSGSSVENDFQ